MVATGRSTRLEPLTGRRAPGGWRRRRAGGGAARCDLDRAPGRGPKNAAKPVELTSLTGSQLELVRLVRRRPGVSVAEAAAALRLAPNTVSTLVRALTDKGAMTRFVDPADRRVARLDLDPDVRRTVHAWRDRRAEAVAAASLRLSPDERDGLGAAAARVASPGRGGASRRRDRRPPARLAGRLRPWPAALLRRPPGRRRHRPHRSRPARCSGCSDRTAREDDDAPGAPRRCCRPQAGTVVRVLGYAGPTDRRWRCGAGSATSRSSCRSRRRSPGARTWRGSPGCSTSHTGSGGSGWQRRSTSWG